MDAEQLAILRELADRGSVTEVAAALNRTPSAISQQLKALQRAAGLPLVERVGRGVRLTEAGQALAAASLRLATAMAEVESEWSAWRGEPTGRVRVGTFFSAAELLVPGLLTRLRRWPGIELELAEHDVSEDAFAALVADCDVVIAHRGDDTVVPARRRLEVVPLVREPVDVAVGPRHRFARRRTLRCAEVVDEPWVAAPEGFPLDRLLRLLSATAGRPARVAYRSVHFPLMERLVATEHAVALLPRYITALCQRAPVRLIPLADVDLGRHIEALVRPDKGARRAVRVVIDQLRAEASAIG